MNYAVAYPDSAEGLPLLVYLHGAGERGELQPEASPLVLLGG